MSRIDFSRINRFVGIFAILSLGLSSAIAGEIKFEPMSYTLESTDKLKITGFDGEVVLTGVPENPMRDLASNNTTDVNADASNAVVRPLNDSKMTVRVRKTWPAGSPEPTGWSYSVVKSPEGFHIKVKGPKSKEEWFAVQNLPKFYLNISAPKVATTLNWHDGKIHLDGWKGDTEIAAIDVNALLNRTEGKVRLVTKSGEIKAFGTTGDIRLETHDASVNVTGAKGTTDIRNFTGKSTLNEIDSSLDLASYDGKFSLSNINGPVNFSIKKGDFRLKGFEGQVSGDGFDSNVRIGFKDRPRMNVKMDSGTLRVWSPPASGAYVSVGTEAGDLYVPRTVKINRYPSLKLATGRLSGVKPGRIYARSKAGNIYVQ